MNSVSSFLMFKQEVEKQDHNYMIHRCGKAGFLNFLIGYSLYIVLIPPKCCGYMGMVDTVDTGKASAARLLFNYPNAMINWLVVCFNPSGK